MYNSGINENVHYRVIIYDKNDEIIEDIHIIGQDNAYNYGKKELQNWTNNHIFMSK